jgi:ubiquinone/menaquinone biosynthesis C-methylase UbiE
MNYQNELISSGILMENANNFITCTFDNVKKYVNGKVLEVGGGSGNFSKLISAKAKTLSIIEIKKKSIIYLKKKLKNHKNINILEKNLFDINKNKKFDTIVLFDVLEHIKKDELALKKLLSLLTKNGHLIIKVPAFSFLYSNYDRLIGHYKRYKKKDFFVFQKKLDFFIKEIYYFDPIGALGWWFNYCFLKKDEKSNSTTKFQIKFYDRYLMPIIKFIGTNFFFGITLFVIITKKNKTCL